MRVSHLPFSLFILMSPALAQETTVMSFPPVLRGHSVQPSPLVANASGTLFGTAAYPVGTGRVQQCSAANGCGNVYSLTPPAQGSSWTFSTLYSFMNKSDGYFPQGPLAIDSQGALYGVAYEGGTGKSDCRGGAGTVWKLTPSAGTYTLTTLHDFGPDGLCFPAGGLALLSDGTLVGEALGKLYALTPGKDGYSFEIIQAPRANQTDEGKLTVMGGAVFGTYDGRAGTNNGGLVFKLTRDREGAWSFQDIYHVPGGSTDPSPFGPVLGDTSGNIYVTTFYGGPDRLGSALKLSSPQGGAGQWTLADTYNFGPGTVGHPSSIAVDPSSEVVYGDGTGGKLNGPVGGLAGVFSLTPQEGGGWSYATLKSDGANCAESQPGCLDLGLILASDGDLYGIRGGGTNKDGRIYQLRP